MAPHDPRAPHTGASPSAKLPPDPDRPLTQDQIDRIMAEVYRIILSAGAAHTPEDAA